MSQLTIGDITGGMDARSIGGYVMQLTEQLRYVLNNIGEENMSQDVRYALQMRGAVAGQVTASELDVAVKAIESRYDHALQEITQRLDADAEQLTENLDAMDERITAIDERLTALETRLNALEQAQVEG